MSKYADVLKQAKDLLSKSYNYNNKVELKTSTATGVNYTAEAVVSKPSSTLVKADYANGNFKVDKLQVGSDKKIVGEFSLADAFAGTKLSFKASDGTRATGADAVTAVVGLERKDKSSVVTVDIDALKYTVDATACVNYEGILLGGQAKASFSSPAAPAVTDYNVLLGYKDASSTVAVVTDKKASGVTAGVFSVVNADLSTAAVAKFPLAFKTASAFDVEVGVAYKAAPDALVHAKVNAAGKAAVSYAQTLNKMAKVTFAAEVDVANIGSDDHKMGINLAFSA